MDAERAIELCREERRKREPGETQKEAERKRLVAEAQAEYDRQMAKAARKRSRSPKIVIPEE